jgi:hypothetical protein
MAIAKVANPQYSVDLLTSIMYNPSQKNGIIILPKQSAKPLKGVIQK